LQYLYKKGVFIGFYKANPDPKAKTGPINIFTFSVFLLFAFEFYPYLCTPFKEILW